MLRSTISRIRKRIAAIKETLDQSSIRVSTDNLTLIGFEANELAKIHGALDICSKKSSTLRLRVITQTARDYLESRRNPRPGLCLIKIPKNNETPAYKHTILTLGDILSARYVTTIPVLECFSSLENIPRFIKERAPYRVSLDSDTSSFVRLFTDYLFDLHIAIERRFQKSKII